MTDRWVCKRCFADNDAPAAACARCGLIRGAEVSETDRAAWNTDAGGAVAAAPAPGWQRWLRFWWIPVALVVLGVGWLTTARRGDDGALNAAGTLNVTDLQVGDCFTTEETEIVDVDATPCDEPHLYEVFAIHEYQGPLPLTDESYVTVYDDLCVADFEAYVGAPWETSEVYGDMITPSEESYADGDREYICFLYEPDPQNPAEDLTLTESLRGAAR